jgi:hypothetical protein
MLTIGPLRRLGGGGAFLPLKKEQGAVAQGVTLTIGEGFQNPRAHYLFVYLELRGPSKDLVVLFVFVLV